MTGPRPPDDALSAGASRPIRRRSWLEIRWRRLRNPPRPVLRAVLADLAVATVLGLLYLAYDIALSRGVLLPGGDLRGLAAAILVVAVVGAGSWLTWLIVPEPRGSRVGPPRRSGWSAALGFFAAFPIAYLILVIAVQVLKPLLV